MTLASKGHAAADYWNGVAVAWTNDPPHRLWRLHSDAVNRALLERWLPANSSRLLKQDLFDEAVGPGLHGFLTGRTASFVGMDLSIETVRRARDDRPQLRAAVADARRLPLADGSVDVVVSNSTLDHFESETEIACCLRELRRILRPGGELLLTLDNTMNPLVALRNALPYRLLHSVGLLPYRVGASCGPRRLKAQIGRAHV
jgi:SAM-dependent methyltransferase